jgi:small subunit ribosomal protein S6
MTNDKDQRMPANVYEGMFLLDPSKVSGDVANADKQIRGILEKNNAEVLVSRPWDERRLSYQIGNLKKGMYYLTYFSAEGKSLLGIEQDCKLNEMVVRQLILKLHPKMVDTMLSVAKGEHAVALHNIHEEPGEDGAAPSGDGAAEAPRRRGREREKETADK